MSFMNSSSRPEHKSFHCTRSGRSCLNRKSAWSGVFPCLNGDSRIWGKSLMQQFSSLQSIESAYADFIIKNGLDHGNIISKPLYSDPSRGRSMGDGDCNRFFKRNNRPNLIADEPRRFHAVTLRRDHVTPVKVQALRKTRIKQEAAP